jgi:hypothetical protein
VGPEPHCTCHRGNHRSVHCCGPQRHRFNINIWQSNDRFYRLCISSSLVFQREAWMLFDWCVWSNQITFVGFSSSDSRSVKRIRVNVTSPFFLSVPSVLLPEPSLESQVTPFDLSFRGSLLVKSVRLSEVISSSDLAVLQGSNGPATSSICLRARTNLSSAYFDVNCTYSWASAQPDTLILFKNSQIQFPLRKGSNGVKIWFELAGAVSPPVVWSVNFNPPTSDVQQLLQVRCPYMKSHDHRLRS